MTDSGVDSQQRASGSIDAVEYVELYGSPSELAPQAIPFGSVATIRGWGIFVNDAIPCTGALVSIDDGPLLELGYGLQRADVAQALHNPSAGFSGFRGLFSTAHLSLGTHTAKVALRDDRGNVAYLPDSFAFTLVEPLEQIVLRSPAIPGFAHVKIESLTLDGRPSVEPLRALAANVLQIRGAAIDPVVDAAGAAIFAIIGSTTFRARYDASSGGFSIDVLLSHVAKGARLVSLFFIGADRKTVYAGPSVRLDIIDDESDRSKERGITLGSIDEIAIVDPQGHIREQHGELVLTRSDKLFVRGWAIDEAAASEARSVSALVDGEDLRPAVYGLERADVATALRLPDACACGFILVYSVDALAYGTHAMSFRVANRTGASFYQLSRTIDFSVVESIDAAFSR